MKLVALEHANLIKGNFMQLAVLFNDDVDADDVIMTMCNTCTSFDHDSYALRAYVVSVFVTMICRRMYSTMRCAKTM